MHRRFAGPLLLVAAVVAAAQTPDTPVGLFQSHGDVGTSPKAGSIEFDKAKNEYRMTGGGANIWGAVDAFQFAWRRMSGDVNVSADISFVGTGVNAHRKAVLMVRHDLTPGSAYADIAVHGDGLTSLQFRPVAGGPTQEIRSEVKGRVRVRLERRGNRFTVYAGKPGSELTATGPQVIEFTDPVYVGIGVSSHDPEVLETAVFSNVQVERPQPQYRSKIIVFDLATKASKVVYTGEGVIEAPNWSRDGSFLLVNTQGNLYRLPVNGGTLGKIELQGGTYRANNDHDLSFDGKLLGFSASSPSSRQSQVYVANADGSNVRLLTPSAPSYFHGWSPDSKWLAFVAQRGGGSYSMYRVSVNGGPEERLTFKGSYDDGPEYSRDGKWIYFNSDRSGGWDIWRIPSSGGGPGDAKAEQVTSDGLEDWFPHISPDGKWMVFLSFPAGTKTHNDRMKGVQLRMIPAPKNKLAPAKIQILTEIYGGQGTINVNSWAPDSKKFAFVEYETVEQH